MHSNFKEISIYHQLRFQLESKDFDFNTFEAAIKAATLTEEKCAKLLCYSMKHGRLETIKFMLGIGADYSKADQSMQYHAWCALLEKHDYLFDEMIALGLKPDYSEMTLTQRACDAKNPDLIYHFLITMAQQNIALQHAAFKKNLALFDRVMEMKPIIEDQTIWSAVSLGNVQMVIRLIDSGANIHAKSGFGNLLFLAANMGQVETFEYLVAAGLDMHEKGEYQNNSIPVRLLCNGQKVLTDEHLTIIQKYPKECITFELSKDLAISTCTLNALNYIVSLGAKEKPWALNSYPPRDPSDHVSPWHHFLGYSFERAMFTNAEPALFEWLMDQGLDLDSMPISNELRALDYKPTLMHSAAIKGCSNVIPLLVKRGFDVHAKTKNGYEPIHFAKSACAIHAFVAEGVDINCLSAGGLTVTHVLLGNKYNDSPLLTAALSSNAFKSDLTDKRGNNYFHWLMIQ